MRNLLDFSSWTAFLSTIGGLLVFTLVMVGIRLVFMQTIQRRRERENRQINERLKTLIAAYKTLGGSFTGSLHVNPLHLRDLRTAPNAHAPAADELAALQAAGLQATSPAQAYEDAGGSERQRRTRDAVEAALSDVILLGTEEQVQLAAQAAQDMVAGRQIQTAQLVVSLRQFVRQALDLEPIPDHLPIPDQGPLRPNLAGGAAAGARRGNGPEGAGGAAGGGGRGGAGGGAGGGGGGGAGMAMGGGAALGVAKDD